MLLLPAYAGVGVIAGIAAGLFGVGGGLIIVPALLVLFHYLGIEDHSMQLAVGTSLATIVVTAIVSTVAHQRQGAIEWPVFWHLSPGIVLGTVAGAYLASHLPGQVLKVVFGVVVVIIALQMMAQVKPKHTHQLPRGLISSAVGLIIGLISAVVGIGGGTLTVPYLIWGNTSLQKAIATSAACGLPIALVGSLTYILFGMLQGIAVAGASGFIYWPAFFGIVITSTLTVPFGARLTHRLATDRLAKLFALFLLFVAMSMLYP
ncbi:MAG: sulfite exporter TauE/SafE family protein [Gammaproteobacteria bacterium]|nr:sulfite exporter TauE/SafE family protein [Gammaproteobacteria bacterium]